MTRVREERKGSAGLLAAVEAGKGRYGSGLLAAIDWSLEVEEDKRPQSVGAWQAALSGAVRLRRVGLGGWDTVWALALLLGVSIWQGWRFYQGDSGRILAGVVTAVQSWLESRSEFSLSGVEEEVAGLLAGARADVAAGRLSGPAGDNAWEKYQEVLALVPGESAALAGLEQVLEGYEALFEEALAGEEFDKAAAQLEQRGL